MKKLMFVFLSVILFACVDSDPVKTKECNKYHDLCSGHPAGIDYEICADGSTSWYVVNGIEYFDTSYMLDEECKF